ncbi:T9SS type A sorting domain-containing protein, partial [Winogradskyella psychrotolerans]|uniref:T9SS type A sorting domain-containing protein n=1 Tax=Winogradskyella psychrotolerans TaxID=1344585 RepID=UPI001C06D7B1
QQQQQQPLRFRIFDIQNFDDSQGIYIHDLENDTYVNLRNLDYELNIEPGNYTNRFEIVFTPEDGSLGVDELDLASLKIQQNNKVHELSVHNPNGLDIKTIEIFDVAGKRILQANFDAVKNKYDLSTLRLSDGFYVVNVATNSNTKAKSQKIIVKN